MDYLRRYRKSLASRRSLNNARRTRRPSPQPPVSTGVGVGPPTPCPKVPTPTHEGMGVKRDRFLKWGCRNSRSGRYLVGAERRVRGSRTRSPRSSLCLFDAGNPSVFPGNPDRSHPDRMGSGGRT